MCKKPEPPDNESITEGQTPKNTKVVSAGKLDDTNSPKSLAKPVAPENCFITNARGKKEA